MIVYKNLTITFLSYTYYVVTHLRGKSVSPRLKVLEGEDRNLEKFNFCQKFVPLFRSCNKVCADVLLNI